MIKSIYKVTIKNWDKYNSGLKPSHKKIMVSTRFLEDAKIKTLPQGGKLLYLGLLLACGDHCTSSVEASHEQLVSFAGGSGQRVSSLLARLKELQLLTYEIISSFRTERKGKEEKGKEKNIRRPEVGRSKPIAQRQQELLAAELPSAHHKLSEIWNQNCGTLPKVKGCISRRLIATKRIFEQQNEEAWIETVRKIASSDFCKGSTGWTASYDWMIKPGNWLKVQEGNYDNNRSFKKTAQSAKYDNLDALEQKWSTKEVGS